MKQLKKVWSIIENWVEVYIPMALFFLMFCIFIIGIIFRYVIRSPLIWSNEAVSICFLEMVLLASCYVQRLDGHVKFSMVIDMLPPKAQGVVGVIGNAILLVAFIYVFWPSATYIHFLNGVSATPVLKAGLHIVYFPFVIFLALNIIYAARNLYRELMCVMGKNDLHSKRSLSETGEGGQKL